MAATVRDSEYLGADCLLRCRIGDEESPFGPPAIAALLPGEAVRLGWNPAAVHAFGADGMRFVLIATAVIKNFHLEDHNMKQHRHAPPPSRLALGTTTSHAQPTEVLFYFPVAVGGPITKIIDQFATDFAQGNPSSRVTRSPEAIRTCQ